MSEELEGERFDHVVIMANPSQKDFPIGIGLANKENEIMAYVILDLATANKIGERFCEVYNEMLIKVRGDT